MDYPKIIKQHKNESYSFAIILYKLKELGIFRNVTESDYGIDFEIEIVNGDRVEGHCIKVQVKAKETGLVRKSDGHATVGGINQSSLNYWAELSYSTPVVGIAVDLESPEENVYVSEPLFWQAISLLDGKDSVPEKDRDKDYKVPTKTIDFGNNHNVAENIKRLKKLAYDYSLRDFLYAHRWMLRNLNKVFDIYEDVSACDGWTIMHDADVFQSFLENAKIIVSTDESAVQAFGEIYNKLFSYQYYLGLSQDDEPYNQDVQKYMNIILPVLFVVLIKYREKVLQSMYYWLNKDPEYLKLVYQKKIPVFRCVDALEEYCSQRKYLNETLGQMDFFSFVQNKANEMGLDFSKLWNTCKI